MNENNNTSHSTSISGFRIWIQLKKRRKKLAHAPTYSHGSAYQYHSPAYPIPVLGIENNFFLLGNLPLVYHIVWHPCKLDNLMLKAHRKAYPYVPDIRELSNVLFSKSSQSNSPPSS